MSVGKVVRVIAASVATVCIGLTPIASYAVGFYEKDSGVTYWSQDVQEAWAWANVWNTTEGRAFARIDSHKMDTGWFRQDTRTARVMGSIYGTAESWATVR